MTQPAQITAPTIPAAAPPAPAGFAPDVIADVFGAEPEAPATTAAPANDTPVTPPVNDNDDKAPAPAAERVTDRISAAKRAEAKAARERQELATQREELARQKAEQETRAKELELFEQDPAQFFELKKLGPKAVADFLDKLAGAAKPEAVTEKKLSAVEEELKALKEERVRDAEAAKERDASVRRQQAEAEAGKVFVAHIASAPEKYQYLTQEFTETQAVETAFSELTAVIGHDRSGKPVTRLQAYVAQHGEPPTDDVIAEHLDSIAKQRIESRSKASWRKAGDAPPPVGQTSPGDSRVAPPVKGSSPRTLSRADTSQRAAVPRAKGNVWTPEDQAEADEQSLRLLESAMRKTG